MIRMDLLEELPRFYNEALRKLGESTGLDHETITGIVTATVAVVSITFLWLLTKLFQWLSHKDTSTRIHNKSKEPIVLPSEDISNRTAESPTRETSRGRGSQAGGPLPTETVPPASASSSNSSTPTSAASPSARDSLKEPISPSSVLHAGALKKRSLITSSINSVELYREDMRNIAIFYSPSSTTTSPLSPRKAKSKSSLYLASESYIELGSKNRFTVNQLRFGSGKKLQLQAKSQEERDEWVRKIQSAIDSLKLPKKA